MPIAPVAATCRLQRLINLYETLTLAPEGAGEVRQRLAVE